MKSSLLVALICASLSVQAGPLIELSAEASRPAANDLVRASLYSEASGNNPAELARRVNADIAAALKIAREQHGVKVQSGQQATYPIYSPAQKIEGWRMRSEIMVESRDQAAVTALIGQLQAMRLAVGGITLLPSPETRRQVGDEAIREAIQSFQQRAGLIAGELGKSWKIKQMNINQGSSEPVPMPMLRGAKMTMLAEAAPAPMEAGESQISVNISGQIELAD